MHHMVYSVQYLKIRHLCLLACPPDDGVRHRDLRCTSLEVPRRRGDGGVSGILLASVSALKFQVAWACFTRLLIPA